jgi:hypothetical protein
MSRSRDSSANYFGGKMQKYYMGQKQPRLGDLAYTEIAMFGV